MCSFWFYDFLAETKGCRYVARIDDDCLIESCPWDEILEELDSEKSAFICSSLGPRDDSDVTIGLSEFVDDFCSDNDGLRKPSYNMNPYTNVMIINRTHFAQDSLFHEFASRVIDSGCIHINRWGDLPLWGAYLSIQPSPILLNVRRDIRYFHGSHDYPVNLEKSHSLIPLSFGLILLFGISYVEALYLKALALVLAFRSQIVS
ncbi:hypothetical protein [Cyanobium sp. ATX 6F1]|uniref:hypothetical protein n=1 Tax=unclassified Cyanobium TaxID=2627006 RepID=UPI0020CDE33B|nr:hypothetical protein [Cyanobium sp. ATX 6F1]MCP9915839.1 hypothetical protein [Cyanobium sp. ATX 6F1]